MGFTAVTTYRPLAYSGYPHRLALSRFLKLDTYAYNTLAASTASATLVRLARPGGVVSRHVKARHCSVLELIQIDTHRLNQRIQAG